jgi:hypothetical protein
MKYFFNKNTAKLFTVTVACFLCLNVYGQISNGTYVNDANQKLIISNVSDCCFEFDVVWGVRDEWLCIFEGGGTATLTSKSAAYYGDDADWAEIEFIIEGNSINIMGGLDYIGDDCAKFGDSTSEKYTLFRKQK